MESAHFTVDAALLRELGERLIGRAHIALAELVKNAYDADAHTCRIEIGHDKIVVTDDGHGISEQEFHDFWMRVGTTHRATEHVSRSLGRAVTGSKGIGRLSAQFLADEMELQSNSATCPRKMLYALVDWTKIRSGKDIQTVDVLWEPRPEAGTYADSADTGTRITLSGLRTNWDSEDIEALGKAVWMLRSPFRAANRPTKGKTAYDFYVELAAPNIEDAKDHFDKMHQALFANWKARIVGTLEDGRRTLSGAKATISIEFAKNYPEGLESSKIFRETVNFPVEKKFTPGSQPNGSATKRQQTPALDQVHFEVLIFKPQGKQPGGLAVSDMREYLRTYGNVSVYDAGFRLPYYGSSEGPEGLGGHDWLNIAADQGRRLISSELLPDHLRISGRYLLDLPNPGRIFGAVEVDTNHERQVLEELDEYGSWLQIQPGRDRLTPNKSFKQLQDLVRFALDFYANRYRALADQAIQHKRIKEPPSRALTGALKTLERNQSSMPSEVYSEVRHAILEVDRRIRTENEALDSRAVILAPLATAGMAALAMDHEIARETNLLSEAAEALERLVAENPSPILEKAATNLATFHRRFNSYRMLFSPLADTEDREATRRLQVSSLASQVVHAVRSRMPGVAFDLEGIPNDLHFPVGAFVEWSAVLQNILFNAWNAMLESERKSIQFAGTVRSNRQLLYISDTGAGLAMPLADTHILFDPFQRETEITEENRSLAIGGQGLGLTIVRMIAAQRRADVRFAPPRPGYSTTIEIAWKV